MSFDESVGKRLGIVTNLLQLDEQDTFFIFVNEAISRANLEVFVFDADDLSKDGCVMAKRIDGPITYEIREDLGERKVRVEIHDFDLVFLKKDPPIDASYEYLLKTLLQKKIPTVNHAAGVLGMGTKSYLENFPELTPKTFYSKTIKKTLESIKSIGNSMIKKSDSSGGKGVKHISYNSGNFYHYRYGKEISLSEEELSLIIKKYLEDSLDKTILIVEYLLSAPKRGDKRVVLLNGEILGSYIRLPDAKTGVCACADNGAKFCDPTKADYEIARVLRPHLKNHGICLAALDLLIGKDGTEYLSEINVFNPGFCNLDVVHPELNIKKKIIDMLCKKMLARGC
ncbi:hypothetical protein HOG48_03075 [Candidatus Peregrinibacteria bacterium]|jgi:glutathione synthase|nr:hypothetical protein [Candidatus Peregrinibacteria bacterium]